MKLLLLLISCIGFIENSIAQDNPLNDQKKKDDYFYVAPVDLFLNTIQLGYEKRLKNHNTIALFGGFKMSKKDETINRLGGSGELQYRINLLYNKEALSSVARKYSTFAYFAPFVQYKYEAIKDNMVGDVLKTENTFVNSGFGGLGFGCRLTALENRFCFNLYAGGGLRYSDLN